MTAFCGQSGAAAGGPRSAGLGRPAAEVLEDAPYHGRIVDNNWRRSRRNRSERVDCHDNAVRDGDLRAGRLVLISSLYLDLYG